VFDGKLELVGEQLDSFVSDQWRTWFLQDDHIVLVGRKLDNPAVEPPSLDCDDFVGHHVGSFLNTYTCS
jgi:hypothetical protein